MFELDTTRALDKECFEFVAKRYLTRELPLFWPDMEYERITGFIHMTAKYAHRGVSGEGLYTHIQEEAVELKSFVVSCIPLVVR